MDNKFQDLNTNGAASYRGEVERVRANTDPAINARIDREIEDRVRFYESQDERAITRRIEELEREWSIERIIEVEAASMGLLGLTMGLTVNRKFLILPAFVAGMVLLHGAQGWYPFLPVFRRAGIRTRQEIDQEKYALKAIRGDFSGISSDATSSTTSLAQKAWQATCA